MPIVAAIESRTLAPAAARGGTAVAGEALRVARRSPARKRQRGQRLRGEPCGQVGAAVGAGRAFGHRQGLRLSGTRVVVSYLLVGNPPRKLTGAPEIFFRSAAEGVEQVADLGLDGGVGGVVERGGDLVAEGLAVAFAEPVAACWTAASVMPSWPAIAA